jgi:replication factor C subunit 2/4
MDDAKEKTLWIEKYRVVSLDKIVGQDNVINMLKNIIVYKEMPNLLFWGKPGVGKTSAAMALCVELYGKHIGSNVLELNASDERGIDVVRTKIMNFTKKAVRDNKNKIPFKIIILDESESITEDAQSALRKVMESYSDITRFIFICNNLNSIKYPIMSRCMLLKFNTIRENILKDKINEICECEDIHIHDDCIDALISLTDGDLRKCLSYMQNIKYIYNNGITKKEIYLYFNHITYDIWENTCNDIIQNNGSKNLLKHARHILQQGYVMRSIIDCYVEYITKATIDDNIKGKLFYELHNIEMLQTNGADEYSLILKILDNIRIFIKNEK